MKTYNDIKFKLFLCSNNSKIEINIRFRTLLYCSTLIEKILHRKFTRNSNFL